MRGRDLLSAHALCTLTAAATAAMAIAASAPQQQTYGAGSLGVAPGAPFVLPLPPDTLLGMGLCLL